MSAQLATTTTETDDIQPVRRSARAASKPPGYFKHLGFAFYTGNTISAPIVPQHYSQAMKSAYRDDWIQAMKREFNSLKNANCWELVSPPDDAPILPGQWVYALKYIADGLTKALDRVKFKRFRTAAGLVDITS